MTADLDIVLRLARRLQTSTAWGRSLRVMALAEGFADSLAEELDYTIEADNMAAVAAASQGGQVAVPDVYRKLSGPTVLVMQRLPGTPVADANELLAGMPPGAADSHRRQAGWGCAASGHDRWGISC